MHIHHTGKSYRLADAKYSDYSVANTPWKDGKGDLVREFTDACRELGMKVGIYYSPAQRDWSEFSSDKEYDDYFIGQVGELLQNYGNIVYLWFDGCGSEGHKAICSFPTVRTNSLKIRITDSDGDYRIRSVKAYYVQ